MHKKPAITLQKITKLHQPIPTPVIHIHPITLFHIATKTGPSHYTDIISKNQLV